VVLHDSLVQWTGQAARTATKICVEVGRPTSIGQPEIMRLMIHHATGPASCSVKVATLPVRRGSEESPS
jgi:hypothetical protein